MKLHLLALLVACAGLIVGSVATAANRHPQPATPSTHSTMLPATLTPAVAQALAAHLPQAWAAHWSGHGAGFTNPAQHLTVRLDSSGLRLAAADHARIGMQLMAYVQGAQAASLKNSAILKTQGTRVQIDHGHGLTEWYVNSPLGVEQGFTLAQPLNNATSVTLTFSMNASLTPVLKYNSLEFQNRDHKSVLHYGDLLAFDAERHPLPARMTLARNRLTLNIDTRGARYPVTVDPLFSNVATLQEPTPAASDEFGLTVSLSADGTIALVAAPGAAVSGNVNAGRAYVFTATNGVWSTAPVATFSDPAAAANDQFGNAAALSADGTIALVGAVYTTVSGASSAGKAYVFTATGGIWSTTPVATFSEPTPAANDYFGSFVALSGDGTTALIGTPGAVVSGVSDAGKAYVFTATGGVWSTTPIVTFSEPAAVSGDGFGQDVALSGDGTSALIGTPYAAVSGASSAGKAYVYTATSGTWSTTPTATFSDPAAAANDQFGYAVTLSGDGSTALIGAVNTAVSGEINAGTAYVFTATGGIWSTTPAATRSDPGAAVGDNFGSAVALSNDGAIALIGTPGADVNGYGTAGRTYVFAPAVDLSLAMSSNPASAEVGGSVTYMLTATNSDPTLTATNLTLTDKLPASMTYVSISAAGGSCNNASGTVTCTLASLARQATWQPSITVTATAAGNIMNTASVTSSPPANTATNNATVTTSVSAPMPPPPAPPTSSSGGGGGGLGVLSLGLLTGLMFTIRRRRMI